MRCVMLMFDSLNRHALPPYAREEYAWVHAPNFARLAQRCTTFDKSYVCSMPCMPARRDLHTGRPNFLHAPWGPLEPFDDSMPQMLAQAGVYTHLCSDHYHYWEDGGATYHGRYSSWEFYRGQEGDPCIGQVADPQIPANINGKGRRSDWVNREHFTNDRMHPQSQTVAAGLRFLERNCKEDRWMLQVECFDPHEPFTCDSRYRDLYPRDYNGPLFDWPGYQGVTETPEQVQELQRNYAALLSKCDESVGHVLDAFDRLDLWKDTMLVVWTDHGFMLGEHGCWAKNWMPLYEEVGHTPLFVWDPRHPASAGQRRGALVQPAIDLAPTLLRFFGQEPTERMTGRDLAPVVKDDAKVRDAAIFGYFGQWVNVTDGRHVYMRAPEAEADLYRYTLMPTNMRGYASAEAMGAATLHPPLPFTKGYPLLRFGGAVKSDHPTLLFDVEEDPRQARPLQSPEAERRMLDHLRAAMHAAAAPPEQFARVGLA